MIHTEHYRIRTNEIDQQKKLTTSSLIQLMQETSMQQVIDLKASVWDLESRNISWVLLRKEMEIFKEAHLNDQITIQTYPTGFERIFAFRDYIAYNESKEKIAQASSTWTLINTKTRKPERIPEDMFKYKTNPPNGALERPRSKIQSVENCEFSNIYKVNYLNLDWNGHVNNVFMAKVILESMPEDYLFNKRLKNLTLHYKAESFFKDELEVQFQKSGAEQSLHRVFRKQDGKDIVFGKCTWDH